jgi:hypothetical protein
MSQTENQTQEQKEERRTMFWIERFPALRELLGKLISYQEMARGVTISVANDHLSIAHATADSRVQIDVLPDDTLQITADDHEIIADLRNDRFYILRYEGNVVAQTIYAKYLRTENEYYSVVELITMVKRALTRLQMLVSRFAQNWYEVD